MSAARKTDDDDSDGAIHKMDTLPPPEGEDDAYSAATRIGPLARGLVQAMMDKAQADENTSSLPPPVSMTRDLSLPRPARVPRVDATIDEQIVQRMYDEIEDGDLLDPTALLEMPDLRATPPETPIARTTARLPPPFPPRSLAPATFHAEPLALPASHTISTRRLEVFIFIGTVLLLAIPATLAFLYWVN